MATWRFEAIGTPWCITTEQALDADARAAVLAVVEEFDLTWSRFRSDGCIAALRRGEPADLGPHALALFSLYDELAAATDGAMNPLVGAGLERLGYDAELSLVATGEPEPAPAWSSAVRNGSVLQVPPGTVLDVGAAGKGLLVDLVAEHVTALAGPCVVDASGDLTNRSGRTVRVALEHPEDPELAIGVAEVPEGWSVAGSATNRRAWGDGLHHVLDARTGRPAGGVVATWVVDRDTARADALATALFLTAPERLPGAQFLLLRDDGSTEARDFPAEVFT